MHYHVQVIHSQARQNDLLAEAHKRALLAEAEAGQRRAMPALLQARNAVGVALIRIGERLQTAPIAGDCHRGPAGPFGLPQAPVR